MAVGVNLVPLNLDNHQQVKFMYDVRTAPAVAEKLLGEPPVNFEKHVAWLSKAIDSRHIFLITVAGNSEPEDGHGSLIGYCQVYNITSSKGADNTNNILEVGWCIHPRYHNKGYGTIAVKLLVAQCRLLYPHHTIELFVKKDNTAAIIIYLKAGFLINAIADGAVNMKLNVG